MTTVHPLFTRKPVPKTRQRDLSNHGYFIPWFIGSRGEIADEDDGSSLCSSRFATDCIRDVILVRDDSLALELLHTVAGWNGLILENQNKDEAVDFKLCMNMQRNDFWDDEQMGLDGFDESG